MVVTLPIKVTPQGLTLPVRVTPRAKRNAVAGVAANALKVYVTAPPEDGRANEAVIEALAEWLDIKRRQIDILAGATSRNKIIRITGVSRETVTNKLAAAVPPLGQ